LADGIHITSFNFQYYFGSANELLISYFIIANHGIVPIEVKSGDSSRLKSLQLFMQHSPSEMAIQFWGNHESKNHFKTPLEKHLLCPTFLIIIPDSLINIWMKNCKKNSCFHPAL